MARRLTTIYPKSRDSRFDPWHGQFLLFHNSFLDLKLMGWMDTACFLSFEEERTAWPTTTTGSPLSNSTRQELLSNTIYKAYWNINTREVFNTACTQV
jgi:hypothetical protein